MALPLEMEYTLEEKDAKKIYMTISGKREKRLYLLLFSFLGLGFAANAIYMVTTTYQKGGTVVGSNLQNIMVSLFVAVVCIVMAVFYHLVSKRRREEMIGLLKVRFAQNKLVLGRQSFRYQNKEGEIYTDYEKLYEAHESDQYFLLITGKQEYIPIPKEKMKREDFAELSFCLTREMGKWFIKNGRPNVEVEMQKVFSLSAERKEK